ncbi:hypothetical protein A9Z42_0028970 [Trichoderma parareesei]|uniref:Uncharacterized protein n=1 Tax=Trichoderma parareesei TaxID=858221 RepID=A0A2H2Z8M4_TRIPA|nr:hypothetical protein A9Z42_0028970 [Trichoderma parareesei]
MSGKRSAKSRRGWTEDRLIVSTISQHMAADLCNSATSWGPDFIGSDGMFCDMETKTMTPVCSLHDVDGCINVNVEDKTTSKRSAVAKRQVETKHKSYGTISQWS